ncbi:MAG: macro domain-containing protein [Promethearchaeota archaeon]
MALQKTINNTNVEVFIGSLTEVEYDAIIIPSNTRLLPSGELRCAVLRAAGPKVQHECNFLINHIGLIPDCTAVVTSGGNLKSKNIIHVVGPKMASKPEVNKLMHATWNCLKVADEKGFKSVGISSLSKRVYLFTPKICAEFMIPTINKFVREQNNNIEKIAMVLEDQEDYDTFSKKFEEFF